MFQKSILCYLTIHNKYPQKKIEKKSKATFGFQNKSFKICTQ